MILSVTDQGPGIAPENRRAVFERFAQLDKGGRAGSGSHHRPDVRRSPRRGDLVRGRTESRRALRLHASVGRRGRAATVTIVAKILVIDDDPSLNRALRLGLQAGGHDVTTAATGEHGISQPRLTSPDVVVLDMGLPDMDGITVCRTIRGWSDVPIIVLSATGDENRKVAALGRRGQRLRHETLQHARTRSEDPGRHTRPRCSTTVRCRPR